MASVMTTTQRFNGAAAEAVQVVAVADHRRKYIGLYASTGSCKVSIGEVVHANTYITLAQGNLMELAVNYLDKVQFSTTGAVLTVIQDINSAVVATYDFLTLTYDGYPMYYRSAVQASSARQGAPIFA